MIGSDDKNACISDFSIEQLKCSLQSIICNYNQMHSTDGNKNKSQLMFNVKSLKKFVLPTTIQITFITLYTINNYPL